MYGRGQRCFRPARPIGGDRPCSASHLRFGMNIAFPPCFRAGAADLPGWVNYKAARAARNRSRQRRACFLIVEGAGACLRASRYSASQRSASPWLSGSPSSSSQSMRALSASTQYGLLPAPSSSSYPGIGPPQPLLPESSRDVQPVQEHLHVWGIMREGQGSEPSEPILVGAEPRQVDYM